MTFLKQSEETAVNSKINSVTFSIKHNFECTAGTALSVAYTKIL